MEQQAGATQLCLNVQSATLLPGSHEIQDVRMRTYTLMVPGFLQTSVPLTVTPEALSRALDCIQAAILVTLHLEKKKKKKKERTLVSSSIHISTPEIKGHHEKRRLLEKSKSGQDLLH